VYFCAFCVSIILSVYFCAFCVSIILSVYFCAFCVSIILSVYFCAFCVSFSCVFLCFLCEIKLIHHPMNPFMNDIISIEIRQNPQMFPRQP